MGLGQGRADLGVTRKLSVLSSQLSVSFASGDSALIADAVN
jgi:hypothetical protein